MLTPSELKTLHDNQAKRFLLKDDRFKDTNGNEHKQFQVRSMGSGRGYGILNTFYNTFVLWGEGISKEEAESRLATATHYDYQQWLERTHPAYQNK